MNEDRWVITVIALALSAIGGVIGFVIYDDMTAEKFSLRKNEWRCTQSHVEVQQILMPDGRGGNYFSSVPNTICDQWSRV